ncbi:MAG: GGDEF domain-containing protein [Acholeplasmatales bacterium]|nr:GGDEF domain-containing protein [Acholeplasmatales bacterium]
MYKLEDLKKYEYFNDINIDYALDPLTGVLSRTNILGFARHLVENNVEFMMGILDIDNFKLINDNYGHKVGDGCLQQLASNLAKYVGNDGLVGRFGGDEFIVISFKGTSYDDVHEYIEKMFNEGNIVRKKFKVDNVNFYVTATIGCASFPKDAKTYDELFLTIDKALYRGKTKGRNCFIVYVEAKHKNIEVHKMEQSSLPNMFSRISELADNNKISVEDRVKNILDYITLALQISQASLLLTDKSTIVSGDGYNCNIDDECLDIFKNLTANDTLFIPTGLSNFANNKKIAKFVSDRKIITFIVSKIVFSKKTFGYLILFEDKITRIWQEREAALLLYLNKVIEILFNK